MKVSWWAEFANACTGMITTDRVERATEVCDTNKTYMVAKHACSKQPSIKNMRSSAGGLSPEGYERTTTLRLCNVLGAERACTWVNQATYLEGAVYVSGLSSVWKSRSFSNVRLFLSAKSTAKSNFKIMR